MTDRELLDKAMALLSDSMQYVTWTDCAGYKCRTPSCHACGGDQDPEELYDTYAALRKAIKDRPEDVRREELKANIKDILTPESKDGS